MRSGEITDEPSDIGRLGSAGASPYLASCRRFKASVKYPGYKCPLKKLRPAPGIALLLAPYVSLRICSSLAPRTARRGATTISGKYAWQSLYTFSSTASSPHNKSIQSYGSSSRKNVAVTFVTIGSAIEFVALELVTVTQSACSSSARCCWCPSAKTTQCGPKAIPMSARRPKRYT